MKLHFKFVDLRKCVDKLQFNKYLISEECEAWF